MIKSAVVGFGFMGRTHALNILRNSNFELAALADSNPALFKGKEELNSGNIMTGSLNREQIADIPKYSSLEQCLDNKDIEAVFICLHTGLHYEMTMKALSRGKHVFLEKPFCLNISQAQEMVDLAAAQHKLLMIGHVVRFMKPYTILKQLIESNKHGAPQFVYLSRFCGLPAWGEWKEKHVSEKSGGALFDLVIHDIDFASSAFGIPDEIKSSCFPGKMTSHDYVSALWSYSGKNIHVRIEGGNTFHSDFPFQAGYIAKFENASLMYNSLKGNVIHIADDNGYREIHFDEFPDGYYDEIEYFAGCIRNNLTPDKCSPESSLESIKLCYRHI